MAQSIDIAVVGGGAAGYFGALAAAAAKPALSIVILEAGSQTLSKVTVSGGGRCNVTHHCFEIDALLSAYPRGAKELRSAYSRFQPRDTVDWFSRHGVQLKTEADGRTFPTTDSSQTIVDCLERAARDSGISVRKKTKVNAINRQDQIFELRCSTGETFRANQVLLASGGARAGFKFAEELGHSILPPVPSLFTFNIKDPRLEGLAGVSASHAALSLSVGSGKPFNSEGPLLITHWGLSGPAVLKLSAWAARELAGANYSANLNVNWLNSSTDDALRDLLQLKLDQPRKILRHVAPAGIVKRLWEQLLSYLEISPQLNWADISKKDCERLAHELTAGRFKVQGKGVFKEEFVTCGGVSLAEVDFRTLQSKLVPGLFFAGEVLDIDGLTGGYNFQAAWTTAYIAGSEMARISQT